MGLGEEVRRGGRQKEVKYVNKKTVPLQERFFYIKVFLVKVEADTQLARPSGA